ncbi:MAG: hypothetical protein Q9170_001376 [Blastenia crenularia]
MDSVDIFDVSSIYDDRILGGGLWYKQQTTGDVPTSRVDFCLILVRAVDTSSANIYMYGGRGLDGVFFDDVHILSLPSFTWTKVYQGTSGRYGHTCHRAGTRTMLSVGGALTTDLTTGPCDWQTKGINVFDLSNITWSSKYTMTTEDYAVPSAVIAKIGGTARGNATMTAPAEGFAESGLAQLFGSTFVTHSVASPSQSAERIAPSHSRRIVVAAATSGGVTFLGLIFALTWFFRRHLYRLLIGNINEHLEMDGRGKHKSELPGNTVFWELPGTAPAELWTPTVSPQMEDEFKFETKSDRDLGWRGEIECMGDLAKSEYTNEKRDQENGISKHARISCTEFN